MRFLTASIIVWNIAFWLGMSPVTLAAKKPLAELSIVYFTQQQPPIQALSNLEPEPEDSGLKGAELGIKDNNLTPKKKL